MLKVSLFSEAKLKEQSFRIRPPGRSNFSVAINKDFSDKLPHENVLPFPGKVGELVKMGTWTKDAGTKRARVSNQFHSIPINASGNI